MAQRPRRRVAMFPHTHWAREWYQPYQTFRLRLVDLLDEFLPRLDRDPAYARFMLDGQMAVVDDYLEVRPEAEPVLRRLAGSGRLSMGPWYILMDEFLVSGETIVRDLQLGDALPAGAPLLWMNGTDHQVPQPWLGRVVAEVNEIQDDYKLVVTSLAEYLPTAPVEGLPEWTGELRSGARANLLMGVASNRVDVKQAAARAELALERRAEPLAALFLPAEDWPDAELRLAWTEVVRNAAHDSVCACSVDEVVDTVLQRYREAHQVADGVARAALRGL